MTLDEAVNQALSQIQGTCKAMLTAGQNGGKSIVMPDGRPAPALQPPPIGNVLLIVLNSQSLLMQMLRHTQGSLNGGFALSDAEANRIADLVHDRIKNGKVEPEPDPGIDLQQVQT